MKIYKTIREKEDITYDLSGRVCDVINFLTNCLNKYGPSTFIDVEKYYTENHSDDWCVYYDRLETDAERDARLTKLKKERDKKKKNDSDKAAAEYAEYQRLSEKFKGL